ncbi:MAG: SusC/RagA family TonB-linked outer membrane protein, partial [Chitinophagaceae bacterium]
MKKQTRRLLLMLSLSFLVTLVYAQQRQITGTVKDNTGAPVAGASLVQKGTNVGSSTDDNGAFSITVTGASPVLVVSSVGFANLEVPVGTGNTLAVVLQATGGSMSEVVVTALGIRRERKSLGYAVQEIKGDDVVEAREPNLANALTGKVAGLQVVRSSTGPAGSSKMVLRGYNSLSGDNQPLIVVDGLPISNFTGATNNDYWNPSLDMGNGIADINPEDIESISVLKGPSAAALYGSRAGNGVIMITTKSGRKQKGIGLTLSSSLGFESIFTSPELQNSFGQGSNGAYDETTAWSWGPKIEGQQVKNWNGQMVPLTAYDNLNNYFDKKGITQNHSISFQQQIQSTSVYTSFNRLEDKSMLPGVKLTRTNLMARAITKFGNNDRWTSDTKVQYTDATANNRPMGGPNPTNGYYMMNLLPRSIDVRDFSAGKNEFGNMIWWSGAGNQVNPYWSIHNNLNQDNRSRFIMNASLKYAFNDWLNAEIKGGGDMYTTENDARTYSGSPLTATGRYSLGKQTFRETNYGTLITANKPTLFGKVGGMLTLGGNLMHQKFSSISASAGELTVPNLFSINNAVGNPGVGEAFNQKKINSVFGSVQFNYDEYLYLDATFRNDWSSALSKANRSFFYPSV